MPAASDNIGILILGYGGPQSLDDVEPFMKSVTGGAPIEKSLPVIRQRYEQIGGKSPLVGFAEKIASKIEDHYYALDCDIPVKIGMLHSAPSIEEAVHGFVLEGVNRIIAVSLSPYYSTASNGLSFERALETVEVYPGIDIECAPEVGLFEPYLRGIAQSLADEFDAADSISDEVPIAFVAHSIPVSSAHTTDTVYEKSMRAAARTITKSLYLMDADNQGYQVGSEVAFGTMMPPRPWTIAYCSRGMRGGEWLGPSLKDFIAQAGADGYEAVIVVPLGFSTDHLETLYDLDIESKNKADELGLKFLRAKCLNDSDELIQAFVASIDSVLED